MKSTHSTLAVLLALAPMLLRAATFSADTIIGVGDTTYDGQDIVVSGCTLTVNGPHSFNSLQVISSGILTHSAAASGQPNNQVNLTIAHDVLVDVTSRIDVSVKGYNAAYPGPGAGVTGNNYDWGSGGGYGGFGADAIGANISIVVAKGGGVYGSITQPVDWGSAGGSCPSHIQEAASRGASVARAAGRFT
jgi:hypothetical protein